MVEFGDDLMVGVQRVGTNQDNNLCGFEKNWREGVLEICF